MVSTHIDAVRIEQAIMAAERETSGELRVSVAPFFWGSVRAMAERAFARLGMADARDRNAVLFLVVPRRRRFVVLGDVGIHERVGQPGWDSVAREMEARCRAVDLTTAIEHGIRLVGVHLSRHFPPRPGDQNELPDEVDLPTKPNHND
jgi:uncharacterized membrane protein